MREKDHLAQWEFISEPGSNDQLPALLMTSLENHLMTDLHELGAHLSAALHQGAIDWGRQAIIEAINSALATIKALDEAQGGYYDH